MNSTAPKLIIHRFMNSRVILTALLLCIAAMTTLNLNPPKTYDSPYLSMIHGSSKAVIKHPGYRDVVLEF